MVSQTRNSTSQTWLQGLSDGDQEVCQEFVRGVKPMVLSCCRNLGLTPDVADDVVGDTYLSVLKGMKSFGDRAQFSSWVWTIAYRQAVNHVRRLGRDTRLMTRAIDDRDEVAVPAQRVQQQEQALRLQGAVAQLPEHWAQAIRLYYWHAQSTTEIATTMQVRAGVVRAYLFRGRKRLRALLKAG
ncbi:RNA polymerase sigma factor [Planctomycetota bacterium]